MRLFSFSLAIALCVLLGLGLARRLQRPPRPVAPAAVSTVASTAAPVAAPVMVPVVSPAAAPVMVLVVPPAAVAAVAPGNQETAVLANALPPYAAISPAPPRADSVVAFALRQLGAAYRYGGTAPATGFDCSGFVQYVYGRFGVAVPHSTALLIGAGRPVPRHLAQRGDLVVFVGTAAGATTPGHAGVVIAAGPSGLRFVHSSSARREPGVKISQVEGTDYERRFMQVRRVL